MSKKDYLPLPVLSDDRYEKMGVSPKELYMRQNGLCWLRAELDIDNNVTVYCTDGKEKARTDQLLNPTFECAKCMSGNYKKAIEDAISGRIKVEGKTPDSDT